MEFEDYMNSIAEKSTCDRQGGDYISKADGLIHCGKCHEAKEQIVSILFGRKKTFKAVRECRCERTEADRKKEDLKRWEQNEYIKRLAKQGVTSKMYEKCTFEADDGRQPEATLFCMNYVSNWKYMKQNAAGAVFYGRTGKGKTFFAGCIANELIKQGVPVIITSLQSLVNNRVQANNGHTERIELSRFQCFVLDDIGVANSTVTAYDIVNEIYLMYKPIIITTNLTPEQLVNPHDIESKRIYDRLIERSATRYCLIENNSSRLAAAKNKRQLINNTNT